MAKTKEPPLLVGLIVLFLGGIGFLVTLPVAACTLIVDYYRPYAPYWCAAFAVCLVCALVLRNTEWGRRELYGGKKPTATAKPETAEKGYAPANPNATLNRAALDTTPEKVKKAQRKAGLRCPKCGSTDVTFLNNTSKSTSAGKALIGAETFGLEGMVVGAAMGRKGKREYLCNHCGKRYSVRN